MTGFEPTRERLAECRAQGVPFAEAWAGVLSELEPSTGRSPEAIERRAIREALTSTADVWRESYLAVPGAQRRRRVEELARV